MVQSRAGAPGLPLDTEDPAGDGMGHRLGCCGFIWRALLGRLEGTGDPAHGDILLPVPGSCPRGLLTPSFPASFLVKLL